MNVLKNELTRVVVSRTYKATAHHAIMVEVPADATDEERAALIREAAIKTEGEWLAVVMEDLSDDRDASDTEDVWVGSSTSRYHRQGLNHASATMTREEALEMPRPADIPDYAWKVIGDHRWASEGAVLVRDDAPTPTSLSYSAYWLPGDYMQPESLMPSTPGPKGHDGMFSPRYLPILTAGAVHREGEGLAAPASVWRDGELIAVVMPMRPDSGDPMVNALGEPVEYSEE